jgi:single-stranded-DNA-specific exonuclease
VPVIGPRWDTLDCNEPAATELAAALKISPVVARLLCQRGLSDPELADRFLNPSLDHLHDPMLLADMGVAFDRILRAIAQKEKIAIHGDYDVDGVTSTVILRRALELLGADVTHFIPERLKDGWACSRWQSSGCTDGVALVISVDCGIRGAEPAAARASSASI